MFMNTITLRRLALPGLALLTASAVLLGCGGGSGNSNKTLTGTLQGVGNAPLAGDTVYYDKGTSGQLSATTSASGQYKLIIPVSSITGSDTLSFYDTSGHLVDIVSVTLSPNTSSAVVTTVAPPTPPSTTTI